MDIFHAFIIAIVEGITEYLPISSTAHMGFVASILGLEETAFLKMFQVSIQFGAILSIVVLYWRKFFDFTQLNFYIKLMLAVIPALVLGKLFNEKIEQVLENQRVISLVLVLFKFGIYKGVSHSSSASDTVTKYFYFISMSPYNLNIKFFS